MNPNWLGVFFAGLGLVAFLVVYRWAKGLSLPVRWLLAVVSVALALPGASFAAYYLHLCPAPAWYFQMRSLVGSEFLIVLVGIAGGMVASVLPRTVVIVPLMGVVAFSIAPFLKPFLAPIPQGTLIDNWRGEVCLQSTPSSCGPASVATILGSLGIEVSEAEIASEAHSYQGGTEAWYLARSVRKRGAHARFRVSSGLDPHLALPAVAGVKLGSIGHFIPLLRREGDEFVIGDPLWGEEKLSAAALEEKYEFTGFYLLISRDEVE